MDRKVGEIMEAFQNCKFEECLRLSEQLFKKMEKSDNKKKGSLSDQDLDNVYLVRAGSLASTAQIHRANALMQQRFQKPIIKEELSFLFLQICSLSMDRRLLEFTTQIENGREKQKIDINRFLLLNRKFTDLSRIFLKAYMQEKQIEDMFGQVYLEYLHQANAHNLINYHRDSTIPECKQINLKMMSMFLDKFIGTYESNNKQPSSALKIGRDKKIKKQIADLKLRIAIHEGRSQEAIKIFTEWQSYIQDRIFTYLRSILALKKNNVFWVKENLKIFRKNLDLDEYRPIFDYSEEFLQNYLMEFPVDLTLMPDPLEIPIEQIYTFHANPIEQMSNYYHSLFTEYQLLKFNYQKLQKKDYYRISLKNTLLLLIKLSIKGGKAGAAQSFIREYRVECGKTLVFCSEIRLFSENKEIFTEQFIEEFKVIPKSYVKPIDELIWDINMSKMFPLPLRAQWMENHGEWNRLIGLYEKNVKQIEKLRVLEKGQRYFSDQYLIIAADSIRKFTQEFDINDKSRQQCYCFAVNFLNCSIQRSPYNFDIKLRLIYFSDKLGHYNEIFKVLETMDIKAVQFDTLGYLYLKNIINYSLWDVHQDLLVKMVRSYQQNYRESSQYAYKAIKASSFNECEQNLCYNQYMDRSYNWSLLLFVLYLKNKGKPNSQFYINQIILRMANRHSFNADSKIIANVIDPSGFEFTDFYGILNSEQILLNQCKIKLLIFQIMNNQEMEKVLENAKGINYEWDIQAVYNFKNYDTFERKLNYQYQDGKFYHERENSVSIRLYNMMTKIKIGVIMVVMAMKDSQDVNSIANPIFQEIKDLGNFINQLNWRRQTRLVPVARSHVAEISGVLIMMIEELSVKTKKKIEGRAQKKQVCQNLLTSLLICVTDNLTINNRLEINKEFYSQSLAHNDELLERVTKMSSLEFKKIFKLRL